MPDDTTAEREQALTIAVNLHSERYAGTIASSVLDRELIDTAWTMYEWLTGPVELTLIPGPITKQDTNVAVDRPTGGNSMTQLHDDEKIDYTVKLTSKRGNEVFDAPGDADDVRWTLEGEGAEATLSLEVSADTRKATVKAKGPVGSGVLRASFDRNGVERFATVAIDVVPGDVDKVELTEGAVTKQDEETPEVPGGEEPTPEPEQPAPGSGEPDTNA